MEEGYGDNNSSTKIRALFFVTNFPNEEQKARITRHGVDIIRERSSIDKLCVIVSAPVEVVKDATILFQDFVVDVCELPLITPVTPNIK